MGELEYIRSTNYFWYYLYQQVYLCLKHLGLTGFTNAYT